MRQKHKRTLLEPADFVRVAADVFDTTAADIQSTARTKHIARARQAAHYLAYHLTAWGLSEIGREIGARDHSTVINSINRIDGLRRFEVDVKDRVAEADLTLRHMSRERKNLHAGPQLVFRSHRSALQGAAQ